MSTGLVGMRLTGGSLGLGLGPGAGCLATGTVVLVTVAMDGGGAILVVLELPLQAGDPVRCLFHPESPLAISSLHRIHLWNILKSLTGVQVDL